MKATFKSWDYSSSIQKLMEIDASCSFIYKPRCCQLKQKATVLPASAKTKMLPATTKKPRCCQLQQNLRYSPWPASSNKIHDAASSNKIHDAASSNKIHDAASSNKIHDAASSTQNMLPPAVPTVTVYGLKIRPYKNITFSRSCGTSSALPSSYDTCVSLEGSLTVSS